LLSGEQEAEGRYPDAERVVVLCDNLNTHTKGAFYDSFAPARARPLVRRIDFCYTPKHGTWRDIAENELSPLTRQCVAGRHVGDARTLRAETTAWSSDVNTIQRGVDWQMKIDDARCKLTSDYPKIKPPGRSHLVSLSPFLFFANEVVFTLLGRVRASEMNDHPNKHIREAVDHAVTNGWRLVKSGPRAHAWGRLYCPVQTRGGCIITVYSTPRVPENHAGYIRRRVQACPH